jgi:F-type H+-transporting ATPase subunit delta
VKSLYEVSVSAGIESVVLAQIKKLREFVTAGEDYNGILKKASLMFDYGVKFIADLKTHLNLSNEVAAFVNLLRKNKRLPRLVDMCDGYISVADAANRKKVVRVSYGKSFSETNREKLTEDLEKVFNAQVECRIEKDPTLVDGIKIQYRSKILDCSLKSRLNRLRNAIGGGM